MAHIFLYWQQPSSFEVLSYDVARIRAVLCKSLLSIKHSYDLRVYCYVESSICHVETPGLPAHLVHYLRDVPI